MKTYDAKSRCPKCGNAYCDSKYHEKPGGQCFEAEGEHVDRICRRCGYQWAEACLTPEQEDSILLAKAKKRLAHPGKSLTLPELKKRLRA